jgi:tRNA modification GTPase
MAEDVGAYDRHGQRLEVSTARGGTIFALSSGAPPAGIGVIRISGPQAADALRRLAGKLPGPRRATLVTLRDEREEALDQAFALWFPGPRSATGEDLAELHVHGGRAVIAAVLDALGRVPGLLPAAPGGFTRRALEHGRIDLTEAEGLADLLSAETEAQRRQAKRLIEGGLGRLVDNWRKRLLGIAAQVEALIDHGEEIEDAPIATAILKEISGLHDAIAAALAQPPAERLRNGLRIVVAGPANAGKSTLVNALAEREVAIASPIAGTTRDLVEASIILDGLPLILVDSAGLRSSADAVEQIGMERARTAVDQADLVLWLGEAEDRPAGNVILVSAKADLREETEGLPVSSLTGEGVSALRAAIVDRARRLLPSEDQVSLGQRHRAVLAAVTDELRQAGHQEDVLILAEHLRAALAEIGSIQGKAGTSELFDALFARFCVGK